MNQPPPPAPSRPSQNADAFAAAAAALTSQQIRNPRLRALLARHQFGTDEATQALRAYIAAHTDDAEALTVLAQAVANRGRRHEAVSLLQRALELAPGLIPARFTYAEMLFALNRFDAALEQLDALLKRDPRNALFWELKAKLHENLGDVEQACAIAEELARENPARADSWMSYANALRAVGKPQEAIAAYRKAIELKPTLGSAYSNLAHLKTFGFSDAETAAMEQQLKGSGLAPEDRMNLQFALAKTQEDRGDYARAFDLYAKGNAAARLRFNYDPEAMTAGTRRTTAAFSREFFTTHGDGGCPSPDPIFIVGRQRSGSTLLEQILASHSMVEGTAELPYIPDIAGEIADLEGPAGGAQYFENLAKLSPEARRRFGEQYLERARRHRKTGRPFFIDKDPGNHFHVGVIALILPNAKIIDARRNPAAACWSQFTLQFKMNNLRLTEYARAWRDYAELMAHFDAVLPGKVHRVIYENLVSDTEGEVRRLLEYLGLPFEENCLRFYETERSVLTPSSEQVRRPITREAVDHWRRFEPWLGPMLKTLGDAFSFYPEVPTDWSFPVS